MCGVSVSECVGHGEKDKPANRQQKKAGKKGGKPRPPPVSQDWAAPGEKLVRRGNHDDCGGVCLTLISFLLL